MATLDTTELANIADVDFDTFVALHDAGMDAADRYYKKLANEAEKAGLTATKNYADRASDTVENDTVRANFENQYSKEIAAEHGIDLTVGSEAWLRVQYEVMKADLNARIQNISFEGREGELNYQNVNQVMANSYQKAGLPSGTSLSYVPIAMLAESDPAAAQTMFDSYYAPDQGNVVTDFLGITGFANMLADSLHLGFGTTVTAQDGLSGILDRWASQAHWLSTIVAVGNNIITERGEPFPDDVQTHLDNLTAILNAVGGDLNQLAKWTAGLPSPGELLHLPDWVKNPFGLFDTGSSAGGPRDGSPLVLDLNGDGIHLSAKDGTDAVYWDIDQDGFRETMGWVTGGDGLLAIDKNGNGTIDDNGELFGNQPATGVGNGFLALAAYDSNHDNKITSADVQFANLRVWIDENGDGISQASELHTLSSLGITSINLAYTDGWQDAGNGNTIRQTGTFTINGQTRSIVDAWFSYDDRNTVFNGDYTLDVRTLFLPDARGYGNLPDLHIAMSMDEALLIMVQDLSSKTMAQLLDPAFKLDDKIADILYRWAGVQDVDPHSRGDLMDARQYSFLEKFTGDIPADPTSAPNSWGITFFQEAWKEVVAGFSGRLLMQSGLGDLYNDPAYELRADTFNTTAGTTGIDVYFDTVKKDSFSLTDDDNHVYVFRAGNDNTVNGNDYIAENDDSGIDTLLFSGVTPSAIRMWADYGTLHIQYSSKDQIDVTIAHASGDNSNVATLEHIAFGDGTLWDFSAGFLMTDTDDAHSLIGSDQNDVLDGRGGNDQIWGFAGNDTLTGGTGQDGLIGGKGDDTYIFKVGDSPTSSPDTISETVGEGVDTIRLTGGILPSAVSFSVSYGSISIKYSPTDTINVQSGYDSTTAETIPYVEKIVFDNGTVWDFRNGITTNGTSAANTIHGTDLRDIINGNGGDDSLYGEGGADTLNGGTGNDLLYGGLGDDKYVYSAGTGMGMDTIHDGGGAADVISLGSSYTASNITLTRVGQYDMAVLASGQQILLIEGQFTLPGSIETLKYGDGTSLNLLTYSHTLNGTAGNDTLYGTSYGAGGDKINGLDGNDVIYAGAGNDTVTGGNGNDYIYGEDGDDTLSGNAGDDTIYSGNGNDTIIYDSGVDVFYDTGGTDTISLTGAGITAANMTLVRPAGNQADLQVLLNGTLAFTLLSQFYQNDGFETIKFANGSTFNLSTVQYTTNGTASGETLYGIGFGGNPNDIINGNGGNDSIYALQGNDKITGGTGNDYIDGGDGNDTYFYNAGDGLDTIMDSSGTDTIQIGAGFVKSDLTWQRAGNTNTMNLILKGIEVMTLTNQFLADQQIETVKFADGSTQSLTSLQITTNGTAANDTLNGLLHNASPNDIINGLGGDDTINGYNGNDTLTGGTGNDYLYGGDGNDTYVYNSGDGLDTISDTSGTDVITIGAGFVKADLTWKLVNTYDLALYLKGVEVMIVKNHFQDGYAVESVKFADNSTYALTNLALTINGTSASETLVGFNSTRDNIKGNAGDDALYGYGGDDTLTGGTGSDRLYGGAGNDTYVFKAGESPIAIPDTVTESPGEGTDTIKLTGGILPDNVMMWTDIYNLHIRYSATDEILVSGYSDTTGFLVGTYVEKITFDNGTVWSLTGGLTLTDTDDGHSILGTSQNDVIDGRGGNDNLYGYGGDDVLTGGIGDDYLYGGAGDDVYQWGAGAGADLIQDENGSTDKILVTPGLTSENLIYALSGFYDLKITSVLNAADNITISGEFNTGSPGYAVETVEFSDGFSVNIGDYANWITGTSSAETLNGDPGGVTRNDTILGGAGNDAINGKNGDDTISGDAGADTIHGNGGNDFLHGGSGNDILYGDAGNDVLWGGLGADTLTGGTGADRFVFDSSTASSDTIKDFSAAEDVLDLSHLISGFDPVTQAITDFVQITDSGANSIVKVDVDGTANGVNFVQVATLQNVTGLTDEASLMASGHLLAA